MLLHNKSKEEVLSALDVSPEVGLTAEEAVLRREKYGVNKLKEKKKKTTMQRFLDQFKDVMIIILLIAAAAVNFIVCIAVACVLEKNAGDYVCSRCGKHFVPTMTAFVFGAHMGTTRRLRCPHCGEKSFCKKNYDV